jgi:hypothetical protein
MYGQRIYVHAGRSNSELTPEIIQWIHERLTPAQLERFKDIYSSLAFGAIIGEVTIRGSVTDSPSPWFVGKFGFLLGDPKLYEKPIPCSGQLGFFEVTL